MGKNIYLLLCLFRTTDNLTFEQDIKKQHSAAFDFIPDPREELITTISLHLTQLPTVIVELFTDYVLSGEWREVMSLKTNDLPYEAHREFRAATLKLEQHASSPHYLAESKNNKIEIYWFRESGFGYPNYHIHREINCLGKTGGLTFSPNSKLLAWHDTPNKKILHPKVWNYTKVWDIEKSVAILTITRSAYPCFFPDSQSLLVVNETNKNESINIWDLTTKKLTSQLIPRANTKIERAAIFDNGTIIMALQAKRFLEERMLHIWKFAAPCVK